MKDCDKPLNIFRTAARKLEYLTKRKRSSAIHLVLVNLCHQFDEDSFKKNYLKSNEDDAKIVNNLLVISPQDI